MSDLRIGCQVDGDMRHYAFIRNTGLPAGTFAQRDWWAVGSRVAVAVSVGGFLLALVCGWGGA